MVRRRDAGDAFGPLRRVGLHPLLQQLEGRHGGGAVRQREVPQQCRVGAIGVVSHHAVAEPVPPQEVGRPQRVADIALRVAQHHAEVVAGAVLVHELAGVGVARQELAVVQAERDDLVDQRQQQRAVGARLDRHPLVGDRRVAGAHRVDRDEAAPCALELRQRDLHRVAVVVFGSADHHEQLGAVEVGPAELPKRAADRVDHSGGHVDRAEAAVRRIVGRAELTCEQPRQRLHLVASGEEGEALRVGGADLLQALLHHRQRLVPFDLDELAVAALAARLAQQRLGQPGRRVLLHDARRALGADHALVQRVVRVALDIAQLAIAQVDADAAAAGAHVAGGVAGFRAGFGQRRARGVVKRGGGHARGGNLAGGSASGQAGQRLWTPVTASLVSFPN